MRWLLLVLGACLLYNQPVISEAPLTLKINPLIGNAPQDVFVQLRLRPVDSDRVLSVQADSDTFNRASAWQIDGEYAPRIYTFWWRSLGAGDYIVTAIVGDAIGHRRASMQQRLLIVGE